MLRKIVKINEELCNGCGLCIGKCAEGALKLIDGKARLVSEVYCDGLGACLGECPRGAITIEEREAAAFDEEATLEHLEQSKHAERKEPEPLACGCPGTAMRTLTKSGAATATPTLSDVPPRESQLSHWPVQLRLVSPLAPYLRDADLLVCADCAPFALPDLHERYLKGRAVVVGCPKLDDLPYYEGKLKDIFSVARPRSVTVLRMEVPCCGGIARAVVNARNETLPDLPVEIVTVGVGGDTTSEYIQ
jgi:NAD-dependent dihydropyrimidine dehydrogenase PreA subunit